MGMYKYEGFDDVGKKSMGQIEASSEREARKILRYKGIKAKKIKAPSILEFDLSKWMIDKGFAVPFGQKELSLFTKQLSIMINAGVPILQAFEILYKSEKHPVLKQSIKRIADEVGEGKTISEALAKQKGFSKLYCNLVKAGEAGGILDTILIKLNEHMEKQNKIKSQIKSAMTYPMIVCIIGAGVIWGMMVFVVPQFVEMLEGTGQKPPAITQFVMDVSAFLGNNTLSIFMTMVGIVAVFKAIMSNPVGKAFFDRIFMKIPIFGGIIIKGNLASFSRTLATMLGAGIPLIDSLEVCIDTIDQKVIVNDLEKVKKAVTTGKALSEPLSQIKYFPELVTSMIRVGEQTGNVDSMFSKVSEVFEEEVDQLVSSMTKLIEPIIIVVLGGIVATILVAMYLPIFMSAGGGE